MTKKVLLVSRARSEGAQAAVRRFADTLRQQLADDIRIELCEISVLAFEICGNTSKVYCSEQGFDIAEFDVVIVRHYGNYKNEAVALQQYCQANGVRFTDTGLCRLMYDKLNTAMQLAIAGTSVHPWTLYGPVDELAKRYGELGEKAVLKDANGSKGRLNFVVRSPEDIRRIHDENPNIFFMLQRFVPNDGDLRIVVLNYKAKMAIHRQGDGSTHLNNTSQGGSSSLISLDKLPQSVVDVAERCAKIMKLEVAGVDIVIDTETNEELVFEVNLAPQISSGVFRDEKAIAYAAMIEEMVQ